MTADDIARKATIFAALGLSPRGTLKAPSTVVLSNLERRMDDASRQVLSSRELEICAARGIRPSVFLVARGASKQLGDDVHNWNAPTEADIEESSKPLPPEKWNWVKSRTVSKLPTMRGAKDKPKAEIYQALGLQMEEDPNNCDDTVDDDDELSIDTSGEAYRVAAKIAKLNAKPVSAEDRWRAKVGLLPKHYFKGRR